MLKYTKISKSSYFYEINTYNRIDKDFEIKKKIKEIFEKHYKRYGSPRITLALRNEGFKVNHKKVERLMRKMELVAINPRGKYKSFKGDFNNKCKNYLLDQCIIEGKFETTYIRNFETTGFNQKWTTDVSEFHIAAGKLYLSPIMDMHNREIIAYSISRSPNYAQTVEMLHKVFEKFDDLTGLIFHSDQGWQYQMEHYQKTLKEKGIIQSMSRKGNCLDNSLMENFFGIMKK